MYKYMSCLAAVLSMIVFFTKPLPYSNWFALALVIFGCGYGLISLLKEKDQLGRWTIQLNILVILFLVSGQIQ
ncbi:hypothetical protein D1B31_21225 [Neobacillus notoginsengisoli]|uniref:DUF3953 domain-containing protein n=1 Tax=Neobacillus notoginsengisoli TaxID=1578198 RepID=A0A417YHQ2_9BACI|nr:hypothetical protein [Neobacillus notoginsengisoli]RHW32448.1 hypothetical protein D1B31_21225 [Neobacillus notoginsengisoli]